MDKYIKLLLKNNSLLILPDFGSLLVTDDDNKSVFFNEFIKYDDGKLAAFIEQESNMDLQEAKNMVAKFVRDLQARLDKGETYSIYGLGIFSKNENGEYIFEDDLNSPQGNFNQPETIAPVMDEKTETVSEIIEENKTVPTENTNEESENLGKTTEKKEEIISSSPTLSEILGTFVSTQIKDDKKEEPEEKTEISKEEEKEETKIPLAATPVIDLVKEEVEEEAKEIVAEVSIKKEEITTSITKDTEEKIETISHSIQEKIEEETKKAEEKAKNVASILEEKKEELIPSKEEKSFHEEVKEEIDSTENIISKEKDLEEISTSTQLEEEPKKKKKGFLFWLLMVLLLILIGGGIFVGLNYQKVEEFMGWNKFGETEKTEKSTSVKEKENSETDLTINENIEEEDESSDEAEEVIDNKIEEEENKVIEEEKKIEPTPSSTPISNPSSGNYYVIIGTFSERTNAEKLVNSSQNNLISIIGQFNGMYYVGSKPYSSFSEAQQNLPSISEFYSGAWIYKNK